MQQHPPCDDRFYTPRASASSSRSQGSNESRFATPRETQMSARSMSSSESESLSRYRTPRSTYKSPVPDRSRDFRRFSARSPHRPASAYSSGDSYSLPAHPSATSAAAAANENGQRDYEFAERGTLPRSKPNLNVFSLARHGRHRELENLLLGIPIDTVDENGNSILHIGAQNGKKKVVKLALQYGANVNSENNSGNTALHFAMKYGFGQTLACVKFYKHSILFLFSSMMLLLPL